jgi:hypothetical protein
VTCCSCLCGETVSKLWPPTGLSYIPHVTYGHGKPWWNDTNRGKQKNLEKNMLQCHFCHHKYQSLLNVYISLQTLCFMLYFTRMFSVLLSIISKITYIAAYIYWWQHPWIISTCLRATIRIQQDQSEEHSTYWRGLRSGSDPEHCASYGRTKSGLETERYWE